MSNALFVGRIPLDCRTRELEDLFAKYGRVTRCDVKRGYGFIEYEDPRDAEDAIKYCDGMRFLGGRIVVEFAKGGRREANASASASAPGTTTARSDECFKCSKPGHFARDCPMNGGSGVSRFADRDRYRRDDRDRYNRRDDRDRYSRRSRSPRRDRSRSRSPRRNDDRDRSRSPVSRRDRSRSPVSRRSEDRSPRRSNDRSPVAKDRSASATPRHSPAGSVDASPRRD